MASFFNFKANNSATSTVSAPKLPKQSRKRRPAAVIEDDDDDDDDIICTQETSSMAVAPSNDKLAEVSFKINHSVDEVMTDREEEEEDYSQNPLIMVSDNPPPPPSTSPPPPPPAVMATIKIPPSNAGGGSLTYVSRCEETVPTLTEVQTPKVTAFSTVSIDRFFVFKKKVRPLTTVLLLVFFYLVYLYSSIFQLPQETVFSILDFEIKSEKFRGAARRETLLMNVRNETNGQKFVTRATGTMKNSLENEYHFHDRWINTNFW